MTAFRHIDLLCPVCGYRFRSPEVVANATGGRRTDFHTRALGTQPLPYLIHSCTRCGYSASRSDFSDKTDVTTALKTRVFRDFARKVAGGPRSGSEKYEAAAKVAEWRGRDARHVADLLLRAAWCCVDEGDTEAERYFRRKAAWKFEEALERVDGVSRMERAVLTYLVGELWRRVGDTRLASAWFNRVPLEVVDADSQRWVIDAACQQRDCPEEWFR